MNPSEAILIIKFEVPACVLVHKDEEGQIGRKEFENKMEALGFCRENGIKIKQVFGEGWKEFTNGALSNL